MLQKSGHFYLVLTFTNGGLDTELSGYMIGDQSLKDQWRASMDGPDGILAQCFVMDQKSPVIPLLPLQT